MKQLFKLISSRLNKLVIFFFFCRSHILPICLPTSSIDLPGKKGIIVGWGKTQANMGHTGTNILQSASVPILSK